MSRLHEQLKKSHAILDVRIKQEEAEVERELALPPLPLDAEAERDRFRAALTTSASDAPFTGIAPPKAVRAKRKRRLPQPRVIADEADSVEFESANAKDARKATGLLTIGKSLLTSGKSEKAADRFRRILADYPDTAAAATARKLLADLE